MVRMGKEFQERHNRYYADERPGQNRGRISAPGAQYLVHLLRGGYLGDEWKDGAGRRALDVGCGSGFNAVTLAMMGWRVSATEINPEIVEHARKTAGEYGHEIDIVEGENERLPFEDGSFDLLVSFGVIHYCASAEAVDRAAREHARVLRPGGLLVLVTNHRDNWTLQGGTPLEGDMIRVHNPGDYRDGQDLFLFRDPDHLRSTFEPGFRDIRVGMNRSEFFTRQLVHYALSGFRR